MLFALGFLAGVIAAIIVIIVAALWIADGEEPQRETAPHGNSLHQRWDVP